MGSSEEFIDFIKEELAKRNWSHAELARRSGISQAHISRVLKSKYSPGFEFFVSIASALNLPNEFILQRAGILSEKIDTNELVESIAFFTSKLTKEEKKLVLDFVKMLISRKDE